MKKSISITLCAALLALSGCSQNTSSDALSSDISSAASESQSTASQEESSGLLQSDNGGFKVEGTKLLDANGGVQPSGAGYARPDAEPPSNMKTDIRV